MNIRDPLAIPDVQSSEDKRKLAIDQVGIKAIRHPIRVAERSGEVQHTVATFNMYVRSEEYTSELQSHDDISYAV